MASAEPDPDAWFHGWNDGSPDALHRLNNLKSVQKQARFNITTAIRILENEMKSGRSRHGIRALLEELNQQMADLKVTHERLMHSALTAAKGNTQFQDHMNYVKAVGSANEIVEVYLESRHDDATSVMTVPPAVKPKKGGAAAAPNSAASVTRAAPRVTGTVPAPPPPPSLPSPANNSAQLPPPANNPVQQSVNGGRQPSTRASIAGVQHDSSSDTDDLEDALNGLVLQHDARQAATGRDPTPVVSRVEEWRRDPRHQQTLSMDDGPDSWIDEYVSGKEAPLSTRRRDNSSLHSKLEPFSGQSLEWFAWIDRFYALVHRTNKEPGEKLALLQGCLLGDAKLRISGLGGGEPAYQQALVRLKQSYGRRGVMRAALRAALKDLSLPPNDPIGFERFANRARTYLFDLSRVGETNIDDIIDGLCSRLKLDDRLAWHTGKRELSRYGRMDLNAFGVWLCDRAAAYQTDEDVAAAQKSALARRNAASRNIPNTSAGSKPVIHARSHALSTSTQQQGTAQGPTTDARRRPPPSCFKCTLDHRLARCPTFKEMSGEERRAFVTEKCLCTACFGVKHDASSCRVARVCGIDGCTEMHNRALHLAAPLQQSNIHTVTVAKPKRNVAVGIIQLMAFGPGNSLIPVNVMLDECSDTTIIREGFVRQLGLSGPETQLDITGAGGAFTSHPSQQIQLKLRTESGECLSVDGSTVSIVARSTPVMDWAKLRERWSHLADLPLKPSGGRIDVLLGLEYAHLMVAEETRKGAPFTPIAHRCQLGWVIRGVVDNECPSTAARINHIFATTSEREQALVDQLRRFCDTESYGIEHQTDCVSPENRVALETLKTGIRKLDDGYEAPLLWKDGEPSVTDNRTLAEHRHQGLVQRFKRDPEYAERCRVAMEKTFQEGYAVRLHLEDVGSEPANYLPIFGTGKRGSSKIRIVFDAAAKHQGKSFNDRMHSGPVLQNSLPRIITRFREGEIAWAADIQAMFSRIRLRPDDWRYHRFLWPERDGSTSVCEMRRLTFGVSCSPCVAIYTTWKAGEDAGDGMRHAADAIKSNLYIDDYLGSAHSLDQATRIATDVKTVLAAGDFHLMGWTSNATAFTQTLQPDLPSAESRSLVPEEGEMVLGMSWKPLRDVLGFRTESVDGTDEVIYTRVGLVSKTASIFDPIGLAAPVTVKAKIRLRELGHRGLKWHDAVTGTDREWWETWVAGLKQLSKLEVPRCLFPRSKHIVGVHLHTFGDASEEAYSAVTYTRTLYSNGEVLVRLVKAATKLAPTKTLSIPKLELLAALMAARQSLFVQQSLGQPIRAVFLWTDSSTVRNWVRATASSYQVFVSHRIGEIQTLTQPEQWRFVRGKTNPADCATRSQLEDEALPTLWLQGPTFLHENEDSWPPDLPWTTVKEEIRTAKVLHVALQPPSVPIDWSTRSIRAQDVPSLVQLAGDFRRWIMDVQAEAFAAEIDRLKRGKAVKSTSRLLPFNPLLDENGLLRVGGRIEKSRLPYDTKHPVILPGRHSFVVQIVRAFHEHLKHMGTDFTLAQIRHHFWVLQGRQAVKDVKRVCVGCRARQRRPVQQLMGNLPSARLADGLPPFTETAVDYCGPFSVSQYRGREKKVWVAVFTCLTTRALYVDLVTSLSSESFLLCFRRFLGLYTRPRGMHSDNGTNFVGAARILREEMDRLFLSPELRAYAEEHAIEWSFQPAETPHFGGAHESMVKSVKKALFAAMEQEKIQARFPTEDVFRTLLFEISGLLNSRPMSYPSSDPDDFRPLCPNDFLNRSSAVDPLSRGDYSAALPGDQFRYLQRMRTLFWDLWRGTYLQSFAARQKWRTKQRNLEVGDLILELETGLPPGQWRTGTVTATYPGTDGCVRAVDIEVDGKIYRRGVTRLCLLRPVTSPVPASAGSGLGEDVAAKSVIAA